MDMAAMQPGGDMTQLSILEGQMTWLVYIVGALIRGRISSSAADSQEVIDGELASRIFQLIKVRPLRALCELWQLRGRAPYSDLVGANRTNRDSGVGHQLTRPW